MSKAVNGWPAYKAANPTFSMEGYAKSLNINPVTLSKYISGERVLGKGQGRPGILKSDEATFITDVVRRHDRGRDGLTPAGVISLVASVKPNLSEKQAKNLAHNLRKRNGDKLTQTTSAQASTTKRTNINIPQQHRFFQVNRIVLPA